MKWGVLAYVVADERTNTETSLDAIAREDLGKLVNAAVSDEIEIAAQIDYQEGNNIWRHRGIKGPGVKPGRESNANNPEVLKDFLTWGRGECLKRQVDRFMLILWGHGAGPGGFFSDASKTSRLTSGNPLSPRNLAKALNSFVPASAPGVNPKKPFDILLVKSCYACSLEIAFQLQKACTYLIASQNLIPAQTVWPYGNLILCLTGQADTESRARAMLDVLGNFYKNPVHRPGKAEVPFALLDLTRCSRIAKPMKEIVQALRQDPVGLMTEARAAASPGDPALLDVRTLCENLGSLARLGAKGLTAVGNLGDVLFGPEPVVVTNEPPEGESAFRGVSLFYHPGYDVVSVVRDTALFGVYERNALSQETNWHDIAFQDTVISQFARNS